MHVSATTEMLQSVEAKMFLLQTVLSLRRAEEEETFELFSTTALDESK
jgi:hypothetical protein